MAHHSPPSSPRGAQRPLEIVLDDSCSIICDDVPANCTIRVAPVEGRNPPRLNPASEWLEDYPPPHQIDFSGYEAEEDDQGSLARTRSGRNAGSPISPPQSPLRSRRNMVESVRRNIHENASWTIYTDGTDEGVFCIRAPCQHQNRSYASSSSTTSPAQTSADRFLEANRPQRNFQRGNILLSDSDMLEIHADSPSTAQSGSFLASPPLPASSRQGELLPSTPPPPPFRSQHGGRCCGMADYNPANYQPRPPPNGSAEKLGSAGKDMRFREHGQCSYHISQPCPTSAKSRCRENIARSQQTTTHDGDGGPDSHSPKLRAARSCRFHDSLPCPAMAGVRCRQSYQIPADHSLRRLVSSHFPREEFHHGQRGKQTSISPSPTERASQSPKPVRILNRVASNERSGGAKPPKHISSPRKVQEQEPRPERRLKREKLTESRQK